MKILYTDDDLFMQQFVAGMLENDFEIVLCKNGHSTLQHLAQQQLPQLILLDINLPDMHGCEVIRACKQHPAWTGIPIIVLSGEDKRETRTQSMAEGASAYMLKPFHPTELLERIQQLLSLSNET